MLNAEATLFGDSTSFTVGRKPLHFPLSDADFYPGGNGCHHHRWFVSRVKTQDRILDAENIFADSYVLLWVILETLHNSSVAAFRLSAP
jgi:hypothetical protein